MTAPTIVRNSDRLADGTRVTSTIVTPAGWRRLWLRRAAALAASHAGVAVAVSALLV